MPTFIRLIQSRTYGFLKMLYKIHCKRRYADYLFQKSFGRKIDWKNPRDLNEKIQYLMHKTDTREWSRLADKYAVRDYIKEKGCEELLVTLYGRWESPEDIDFNKLPNQFVLKTNHGAGCSIVITDKEKIDIESVKKRLSRSLSQRFGYVGNEPHYNRIKPCVIAEQYLYNGEHGLIDYKVWCLDGQPFCIFTALDRDLVKHNALFSCYSLDWQRHNEWLTPSYQNDIPVPRPQNLDKMIDYARILSEGFPQVRVDFYEVNGKVYFGEMTFTSYAGRMDYFTPEQLKVMGDKVNING